MYDELKRLALAPGTEATLAKIQPLASEFAQPLEELYHRWGEDPAVAWRWSFDMHLRLVGLRFSDDIWYIAQVQGRPVSAMVLCRSKFCPQLGSIHRAYTAEPYRRRGLASTLLELAISDFETTGGQALIVSTEQYDSASTFYDKFNFVRINPSNRGTSKISWRITDGDDPREFLQQLLAPSTAVLLRSSDRADVPQLLALFNAPDKRIVRHFALQILGDANITPEDLFPAFEQQEGDVAVLTGLTAASGALVGWGSIMPHVYPWPNPHYQQHQLLVDCYLAHAHMDQAPSLLNEMLRRMPPTNTATQLIGYVPLDHEALPNAYEAAGFKRIGFLPAAYAEPRGRSTDVGIYMLEQER
jgi:GNAT superfamily N-acetyltransferase